MLGTVAFTLDKIGTLLIAYAALKVHHRVMNEHRIDKKVLKAMKFEMYMGVLGAFFVMVGFLMVIFS